MRTGVFSSIFAVIAVVFLSTAADARPNGSGDGQSFDQILPQLREQHPGNFSDAEGPFTGTDGRQHYRVKWVTPQGRVVWFNADAHTGREVRGNNAPDRALDAARNPPANSADDSERRSRRRNNYGDDALGDSSARGNRRGNNGWNGSPWGGDQGDPFGHGGRRRGNGNDGGGFGGWPGGSPRNGGGNRGHHEH